MKFEKYKTIIFDCDGVILNSNKIKSKAFFDTVSHYGKENAKKLVEYHIKNGGVSRFHKFEYFIQKIIKSKPNIQTLKDLLEDYGRHVTKAQKTCEIAKGLIKLRQHTSDSGWMVVSGSYQEELRIIFKERNISDLFNLGIYGSPDPKDQIFKREIENNNIQFPAIYIGDSKYDYKCSKENEIDFIFIFNWTEVLDWKNFCIKNKIHYFKSLSSLTKL